MCVYFVYSCSGVRLVDTWVSDGECCLDTVGGTEVNCVRVFGEMY